MEEIYYLDEINLQDDKHLDEPGPTSDLNPDKELEEEEAEEEEGEEGEEGEDKKKKEEPPKPDWESEENPYKGRYTASQREVNEVLLPKTKQVDTLLEENKQLLEKLKTEKPETFDAVNLQKQLADNTKKLAELQEKSMLDDFISSTPDAKPFREKLKAQARAFPNDSLEKIWTDTFKAVAEAQAAGIKDKKDKQKGSEPDKGSGSPTKEHGQHMIAGMPVEDFNKLPVAKRKKLLIDAGITL